MIFESPSSCIVQWHVLIPFRNILLLHYICELTAGITIKDGYKTSCAGSDDALINAEKLIFSLSNFLCGACIQLFVYHQFMHKIPWELHSCGGIGDSLDTYHRSYHPCFYCPALKDPLVSMLLVSMLPYYCNTILTSTLLNTSSFAILKNMNKMQW